MKRLTLLFVVILTIFCSCSTKQYLLKSTDQDLSQIKRILIVNNDFSNIIPVGIYPSYENIDDFVTKKDSAISDIPELVCVELLKRQINCEIAYEHSEINNETYYIEYQDYWAWDFKKYMHVLKMKLYKNGIEIKTVASQGNGAGMHDYPTPEKQIPLLIDLLLKK